MGVRPIVQLDCIAEAGIAVVLSDGKISTAQLDTLEVLLSC